jgi:hypothetical protein
MSDETVGDRWEEFWDVCRSVIDNERLFDEREMDFAHSMEERLNRYGHKTFISTAQINWLNRLSQKVKDHGL